MTLAQDPFALSPAPLFDDAFDEANDDLRSTEGGKKTGRKFVPGTDSKRNQHNQVERARRESLNVRFMVRPSRSGRRSRPKGEGTLSLRSLLPDAPAWPSGFYARARAIAKG